ncbi:FeoA family protein [Pelosinus propionicus]|uniref:Ferrous iron transport protein A n=1 Tax=Pelosinus propionicus DSM 13327 TaxID=1123291 RepID=A0A1I4KKE1_9FIRM|nr:FeoA family protein [Pelosinus propionicus]SFL79255.1 ferrous iron transport protein A [Pelosinus propionicus DSM 13327]
MPLVFARIGQKCIIKDFSCSCEIRMRMVNMGLFPGCPIEILNSINGTLLLKVGSARVMLEKYLAHQIHVS